MFFGLPHDGALCCATCNEAPAGATFNGGWWGLASYRGGAYMTRLPSFVTDPDWVSVDTDDRYVWNVRHETDSVQAPDIVAGSVTYRCVGMAGSQYADGSWFAPARASTVWYQLHYAPVDDLETTTPRAALAAVSVGDHTTGTQESDPSNHDVSLLGCWLVNDANGDPEHWDAPAKLCHHFDNYNESGLALKTLVGPEHFAYQVRRLSSGTQDRITYYGINQATPTVVTYDNVEAGVVSTWKPLFFSSYAFPMALWSRCDEVNYFGSSRLQNVSRQYRHGKANLPALTVDDSEPAANVSAFAGDWSGEDADDSSIVLSDTACYVVDYEMGGKYVPSFTTTGETPVTLFLNAGEAAFNEDVNPAYGGVNVAAVFDFELIGSNYRFGGCGIFVARQDSGGAFGFARASASAKPDWQAFDTLSFAAGETTATGEATTDTPVWRADDREAIRVFSRRHNGWVQTPEGFGGGVGQFFTTQLSGIITNPYTGPPMNELPITDPDNTTVVQAAVENFFARPGQGTSDVYVNDLPVTAVNWEADATILDGTYLDYVENTAWFWRGGTKVSPLWRVTADGLAANLVGISGWYYSGETVVNGGILAWDGSEDELTETMEESVPPE